MFKFFKLFCFINITWNYYFSCSDKFVIYKLNLKKPFGRIKTKNKFRIWINDTGTYNVLISLGIGTQSWLLIFKKVLTI